MIRRLAMAALLPFLATPASAQSWIEGIARSVATSAAQEAMRGAMSGKTAKPSPQPGAVTPEPDRANKASHVRYLHDLKPADADDKRKAYEEFSRVPCTGCEGGRSYDAWGRQILGVTGFNAWEDKIGAMAVGQTLTWKGEVADGQMTIASDDPVSGFPCKQIAHKLTKGTEVAEREGLFCYGRANSYSGSDRWVEIY